MIYSFLLCLEAKVKPTEAGPITVATTQHFSNRNIHVIYAIHGAERHLRFVSLCWNVMAPNYETPDPLNRPCLQIKTLIERETLSTG